MRAESITMDNIDSIAEIPSKDYLRTFSRKLISLLHDVLFVVPAALFWRNFKADLDEWAESGQTARFVSSNRPDFVLDRESGKLWPSRLLQVLSHFDEWE